MKILIVDDHPTNLKLLRAQLEGEGHTVCEADDGRTALAVLEHEPVDAVISDTLMPAVDGYRLCQLVRQHARLATLPIILYSATLTTPDDEKLSREMGADKFLRKPATPKEICAAMEELLARGERRPAETLSVEQELERTKRCSEWMVHKLQEHNDELRRALDTLDATRDGILSFDPETLRFSYVNQGAITQTGYSREDLLAMTPLDLKPEFDEAGYRQMLQPLLSGEITAHTFTAMHRRKDGSFLPVEILLQSVTTEAAGRLLVTVSRDITERKRVEVQLRLESAAIEAAANAIMITDRTGAIELVNPAFTTLTGYTPAEVAGRNPRELFRSGRHDRAFYQTMWHTILSGRAWQGEMINRRKDGTLYPEQMTITPVREEGEEITHFIAVKQDITERKRAEEQLRAQADELERANEELTRFNRLAAGRELRLIELKQQVNELATQLGEPRPYPLAFMDAAAAEVVRTTPKPGNQEAEGGMQ